MATEDAVKLTGKHQRVEAVKADMSGSTFIDVNLAGAVFNDVNLSGAVIDDVNLAGLRINNANLRGASIVDSLTEGMTIYGVAVSDLFAAYRAANPRSS